jgi:hypothetical protein
MQEGWMGKNRTRSEKSERVFFCWGGRWVEFLCHPLKGVAEGEIYLQYGVFHISNQEINEKYN